VTAPGPPAGTVSVSVVEGDGEEPHPLVGTVLHDRYRVLARIAVGGMGVVYRGERLGLGRAVAIKILHARFAEDAELHRRFDVEARAMSRIQHPHCVSVIDFGVHGTLPYLVMDYVTGTELRELISAGPTPVSRTLLVIRQILAGLGHAHRQGIVHRDIKPENILLTEDADFGDHVRVLDFGLAKLRDLAEQGGSETPPPLLAAGLAVGTPRYMAPEQTRAEKVDARSDLYGVGVLLVELLTGRKPFDAEELVEVLRLHREAAPPRLSTLLPGRAFSDALERVVARALAKRPEDRFQSAVEFAGTLMSTPEGVEARSQGSDPESHSGLLQLPPARLISDPSASPAGAPDGPASAPSGKAKVAGGAAPRALPGMLPDRPAGSPPPRLDAAGSADTRSGGPPWLMPVGIGAVAALGVVAWLLLRGPASPAAARTGESSPAAAPAATRPAPAGPAAPSAAAVPPAPRATAAAPAATGPAPASLPVKAPAVPADDGIDPAAEASLPDVARAHALIRAGQPDQAVELLITLRDANPQSGYVQFLLGTQLFTKSWFSDGMTAYKAAITLDPIYRQNPVLIRHLVEALTSNKFHIKAGAFLARDIGEAARPYLEHAALRNPDADVRGRAARLLGQLPPPK
jgi:serine/threonine-protein kinase